MARTRSHLLGKDTYMFDGKITVIFLEKILGNAIQLKNKQLGLPNACHMVICDRCSSTYEETYQQQKLEWCRRHNVVFMGLDPNDKFGAPSPAYTHGLPTHNCCSQNHRSISECT